MNMKNENQPLSSSKASSPAFLLWMLVAVVILGGVIVGGSYFNNKSGYSQNYSAKQNEQLNITYIIVESTDLEATFYKVENTQKTKLFTVSKDHKEERITGTISTDGKTIVYNDKDYNLQSYDITTGKTTQLLQSVSDKDNIGRNRSFSDPVFSPDGKKIGLRWYGWEISGIAIVNSDGSNYQQFDKGVEGDTISWSPDSKKFVITAATNYFGGEPPELYVANTDSPNEGKDILPKEVKSPDGDFARDTYDAQWSPDGTKLAVAYKYQDTGEATNDEDKNFLEIYTINIDGSDFKRITNNQSFSSTPFWKDNQTILYGLSKAQNTNKKGIYSIQPDSRNNKELYSDSLNSFELINISPDKKYVVYRAGNKQQYYDAIKDVYILDLKSRKAQLLDKAEYFVGWITESDTISQPKATSSPTENVLQQIKITKDVDENKRLVEVQELGFSLTYPKKWGEAYYLPAIKQIRIGELQPYKAVLNVFETEKDKTTLRSEIATISQDLGCEINISPVRKISDKTYLDVEYASASSITEEECNKLWNSLPKERIETYDFETHKPQLIRLKDNEVPTSLQNEYQEVKEVMVSFKVL